MTTQPAGEGISDKEMAAEVAGQTSADLKVEDVFERESDGATTTTEAADAEGDELKN